MLQYVKGKRENFYWTFAKLRTGRIYYIVDLTPDYCCTQLSIIAEGLKMSISAHIPQTYIYYIPYTIYISYIYILHACGCCSLRPFCRRLNELSPGLRLPARQSPLAEAHRKLWALINGHLKLQFICKIVGTQAVAALLCVCECWRLGCLARLISLKGCHKNLGKKIRKKKRKPQSEWDECAKMFVLHI